MTKHRIVLDMEREIKEIFAKDKISKLDVFKANKLFDAWKLLTDYTPDPTPVVQESSSGILDEEPGQTKNLKFIENDTKKQNQVFYE